MPAETVAGRISAGLGAGLLLVGSYWSRRPVGSRRGAASRCVQVLADFTGSAGDDDDAGGFQQWPGVGAHAARDEFVDAQPGERFRRLDTGPAGSGGAGIRHHLDGTASGINDQKIFASAEGRLDAVLNAVPVSTEGCFQSTPLNAVRFHKREGRHVCDHF